MTKGQQIVMTKKKRRKLNVVCVSSDPIFLTDVIIACIGRKQTDAHEALCQGFVGNSAATEAQG